MKIKNVLRVGDVLYRVDPRKLSIRAFKIVPDEVVNFIATNYEDFSLKCEKRRFQIPSNKFPFEFKGLLYFLTEDDANEYVRTQIGM
ncbi:hypothetical protein D0T84_21040 [Dysgonomonas sp. 521]|uniref:hypothetical protein n=1 Tax=Dysgonomonas sp. 521 TaxID=2302932 RepID=UPI0013D2E679|nr:hypothetical protein [Dysgonomonas sp. 521]NDV97363.1 hypothetical protein [Dysgonomonas sp. 521]